MSTTAGAFIDSFNKWKALPEPKNIDELRKAAKFEKNLNILIHDKLKLTFDPLKDIYYDALSKKKQCVRVLIQKSMGEYKRMFLFWN